MTRRRNPTWFIPALIGTGVVAASAAVLLVRVLSRPKAIEQPKQWWEERLEGTMPEVSSFPMGWDLDDVGFYDVEGPQGFKFAWRILKLRSPSDVCDPPCNYVVVATGSNLKGLVVDGFWPTATREQALAILVDKYDQVT